MKALADVVDRVRGGGVHAVTVPPMDGALQPNHVLGAAATLLGVPAPDAIAAVRSGLLVCSGPQVLLVDPDVPRRARVAATMAADVCCAAASATGDIALGLADGTIAFLRDDGADELAPSARAAVRALGSESLTCPTALAWAPDGALLICNGSARHPAAEWKRDLMERGTSGSVWRLPSDGAAERLASHLAYPNGIASLGGRVIVSESWRHRLVEIAGGQATEVLGDLPGYPAGLAPRAAGGLWLAVFAPRSQLIEFVLRERHFRDRMMREVDPVYWIAPSLHPPRSVLEPLQGGALKQLGIMKPWAPTRSYGLVVALGAELRPEGSAHSRADGLRHGVRCVVEHRGRLMVACRGGDEVVSLPSNSAEWPT
jgi:hypothetical protein